MPKRIIELAITITVPRLGLLKSLKSDKTKLIKKTNNTVIKNPIAKTWKYEDKFFLKNRNLVIAHPVSNAGIMPTIIPKITSEKKPLIKVILSIWKGIEGTMEFGEIKSKILNKPTNIKPPSGPPNKA